MCDKSTLFTRYNHLRTLARQHPELIDLTRLNKALGIAQSGETCQHEVADTTRPTAPAAARTSSTPTPATARPSTASSTPAPASTA